MTGDVSIDERDIGEAIERNLAELQARTYHESQKKPTYVIREIVETPAHDRSLAGR